MPDGNTLGSKGSNSSFDPSSINVAVEQISLRQIIERINEGRIDLYTQFQRKGNLWSKKNQSRLIESILLRFPLPTFYFAAEDKDNWLVVDGLQRLWTLKRFIIDQDLKLNDLEILNELNAQKPTFSGLSRIMQRRILETAITAYVIQPGTPKEVKYNLFQRINTTGMALNKMEIRHALNQGPAVDFLNRLGNRFHHYIPVEGKRMQDQEAILRAISFFITPIEDFKQPLSDFLDTTMEKMGALSSQEKSHIESRLHVALECSKLLFGKHAFSRSILGASNLPLFSRPLFETWTSLLMKLSEMDTSHLVGNKDPLVEDFKALLNERRFEKSLASNAPSTKSVKYRFSQIESLIQKHAHS